MNFVYFIKASSVEKTKLYLIKNACRPAKTFCENEWACLSLKMLVMFEQFTLRLTPS